MNEQVNDNNLLKLLMNDGHYIISLSPTATVTTPA